MKLVIFSHAAIDYCYYYYYLFLLFLFVSWAGKSLLKWSTCCVYIPILTHCGSVAPYNEGGGGGGGNESVIKNRCMHILYMLMYNMVFSVQNRLMALWLVRSILRGPLKMRVNFKLLHHGKLWLLLATKNLGRPTDHLGGPLGCPDHLYVASGNRATCYFTHWVFNHNFISSLKLSYITSWSFQWWFSSISKDSMLSALPGWADFSIFFLQLCWSFIFWCLCLLDQ